MIMVCRRFFVKVVGDSGLLEKAIRDYDSEWNLDAFVTHKNPITVSVSGSMVQQEIGQSFLGPVLEEKFHAKCSSITVLPCLPLVPEVLKDKVHPDISPNMVQEGVTNGYFLVNHSLNQTFGEPDFREIDTEGISVSVLYLILLLTKKILLTPLKREMKTIIYQKIITMHCILIKMRLSPTRVKMKTMRMEERVKVTFSAMLKLKC